MATNFHEIQISAKISYGATGGPKRKTEIVELNSGYEERNAPWSSSRRVYDIAYGMRSTDDAYDIMEFFDAREGALYGFRYKDWSDFKSTKPLNGNIISDTDQLIGTGDDVTSLFQCIKTYQDSINQVVRIIDKPVVDTMVVAVDGTTLDPSNYYVSYETGIIALGFVLPAGQILTAGYEFDVPTRFAVDEIKINLANFELGEVPSIALFEVRIAPPSAEDAAAIAGLGLWNWLEAVDINTAVNVHWDTTWGTL